VILEMHATDLKKVIRTTERIPEANIKVLMYELLKIVKYLHSAGVLHRDIKPANILINKEGKPVLCDFGLARGSINEKHFYLPRKESVDEGLGEEYKSEGTKDEEVCLPRYSYEEKYRKTKDLTGYVTTRCYRAPKTILCEGNYEPGIDIWALGCVFAELLSMTNSDVKPKDRKPFFIHKVLVSRKFKFSFFTIKT
jgi:mitogen-activated protein kinase 1/3